MTDKSRVKPADEESSSEIHALSMKLALVIDEFMLDESRSLNRRADLMDSALALTIQQYVKNKYSDKVDRLGWLRFWSLTLETYLKRD